MCDHGLIPSRSSARHNTVSLIRVLQIAHEPMDELISWPNLQSVKALSCLKGEEKEAYEIDSTRLSKNTVLYRESLF